MNNKGNWIIKPKYKEAQPFYKGVAIVKIKNRYGLINKKGQLVINQIFDEFWGFKNGVSVIRNYNKYGFINYRGKIIFQMAITGGGIGDYNWNYGKIYHKKKIYLIDTNGRMPIKMGFDSVETYEGKNNTTIAKGWANGKRVEINL
ncbi:WG repeat-containing protein [Mucilaginibacter paludis]|uniref:WG repeat-containing protein n=1 Tax=Mucilaginibacter paludis TaxID=423351 RepID=UPI0002555C94|nr:WG repeat-containing protein [Mucilaginibacter paludis]